MACLTSPPLSTEADAFVFPSRGKSLPGVRPGQSTIAEGIFPLGSAAAGEIGSSDLYPESGSACHRSRQTGGPDEASQGGGRGERAASQNGRPVGACKASCVLLFTHLRAPA